MHGHMYDLGSDNNGDQFLQTTKELQMLVGRKAKKFTAELVQSIASLKLEMPEGTRHARRSHCWRCRHHVVETGPPGPQGEDPGL